MPRFPPAKLRTDRLQMRLPKADRDATLVYRAYARDPEVTRYLGWRTHDRPEQTESFLLAAERAWESGIGHRPWVIERRQDGELAGMIGTTIDTHGVLLGYVLAKPFWGCGYMTEAVRAVCRAAFNEAGIYRVWAFCDVENQASAKVLEKAGMQLEGILHRFAHHPNRSDQPRDCYCYALVR